MAWFPTVALIFPLLTAATLFLAIRTRLPGADVRFQLLTTCVVLGLLVVIFVEGLNAVHWLTPAHTVVVWIISAVGGLVAAIRGGVPSPLAIPRPTSRPPAIMLTLIAFTVAIVLTVGISAVAATPNNWDSMTYHLSRVMRWAQDGSLAFYPTNIERQLHPPPFAEYALLQIYFLTGGDGLFNLLQLSSMVGSVIGVSFIAGQLGANHTGQLLSALFCAAIPMGIVQASSTQNAYVLAFWLVALVALVLEWVRRPSAGGGGLAGAALGLGILTKGTASIFAAPFGLLVLPLLLSRGSVRRLAGGAVCGLAVVLLLNAGHFSRNFDLYGSVIGPGAEEGPSFLARYTNDAFSVPITASNLARNLTLHLNSPWRAWNEQVLNASVGLHGWLGMDPTDTRTTWPQTTYSVPLTSTHEDYVSNQLNVLLIIVALGALPFVGPAGSRRTLVLYSVALMAGMVLFAALVRWQPWHSRLHLAWFVLAAPLVGAVIGRGRLAVIAPIAVALFALSWPYLMYSEPRPLMGRGSVLTESWVDEMFRARRSDVKAGTLQASAAVQAMGCRQVGLLLDGNDWEYPFWRLLEVQRGDLRIEHVQVQNHSARLQRPESPPFQPCAVIGLRRPDGPLTIRTQEYEPSGSFALATVYVPRGSPSASTER